MQKCILETPDYQSVCGQTRNYHLGVEQQLALRRQGRIIQRRTSQKKTVGQWRPVECDTRVGQWRPYHENPLITNAFVKKRLRNFSPSISSNGNFWSMVSGWGGGAARLCTNARLYTNAKLPFGGARLCTNAKLPRRLCTNALVIRAARNGNWGFPKS